jgi:hypothetical protein
MGYSKNWVADRNTTFRMDGHPSQHICGHVKRVDGKYMNEMQNDAEQEAIIHVGAGKCL